MTLGSHRQITGIQKKFKDIANFAINIMKGLAT